MHLYTYTKYTEIVKCQNFVVENKWNLSYSITKKPTEYICKI